MENINLKNPSLDFTSLYPSVLFICDHGNYKQNCMICNNNLLEADAYKYYDQPTETQEVMLPTHLIETDAYKHYDE